jgi:hypothetical protein
VPWYLLNGGAISFDAARIFLTNRAVQTEDGILPARTIGLLDTATPPRRRTSPAT